MATSSNDWFYSKSQGSADSDRIGLGRTPGKVSPSPSGKKSHKLASPTGEVRTTQVRIFFSIEQG